MYKSIMPPMSEEQIERVVERETNRLDRLFMSGELSQTDYDRECSTLDKWAQSEYDRSSSARNADHIDGYDRDDLGESPDY